MIRFNQINTMYTPLFLWLTIAIAAAFFELGHPGLFYFLSFCVGACITALCSVWVDTLTVQIYVFILTSTISCFVLRYLLNQYITSNLHFRSNTHALQGKHAQVTKTIQAGQMGSVKIGGEIWSARALDDTTTISAGAWVTIVQISGAHVKVQKQ